VLRALPGKTWTALKTTGTALKTRTINLLTPEVQVGRAPDVFSSLRTLILATPLNVLLVFIPIMFVARFVQGNTGSEVFAFAFLALLPTAKIFGLAMEDLTLRVDPHLGRFIRVLAGNMIELISGVIGIVQCQLEVLQASLIGSILINILLVLGCAFLSGGVEFSQSGFGAANAQAMISLMMLGAIGAVVPSAFVGVGTAVDVEKQRTAILRISRAISIYLLLCYMVFLMFQLYSHTALLRSDRIKSTPYPPRVTKLESVDGASESVAQADLKKRKHSTPAMSLPLLLCVVVVGCAMITFLSEYLVGSLTNLTAGKSLTKQWVGLILIPLAGTFARHDLLEAIKYGRKDSMNDSLALSTGSSVNLALFVQPILILLAWAMKKNLTLLYDPFESLALFLSVIMVNHSLASGRSVWLSGVVLVALYAIIALSFWFYSGSSTRLTLAC